MATSRDITWVFRAIDKTDAAFRSVDSKITGIGRSLKTFAGFAGFATIAAGIGSLTKDLIALGSELDDTAKKLGISAESVQVLKFAAEQTGASFESLQSSLQFNTRLAGDAARGNAKAAETFRLLGLDAKKFIDLPIDRRLRLIAQQLASVEDPALRLELTLKALGRSGGDLAPLLAQGAAGLDEIEGKLRSTNSILSNEQVKALDDAGDAWEAFTLRLKVNAAPILISTLNILNDVGDAISDSIKRQQELTNQSRIRAGLNPLDFSGRLVTKARGRGAASASEQEAIVGIPGKKSIENALKEFEKGFREADRLTADYRSRLKADNDKIQNEIEGLFTGTRTPQESYAQSLSRLSELQKAYGLDAVTAARQTLALADAYAKAGTEADFANPDLTPIEAYISGLNRIVSLHATTGESASVAATRIKDLGERFKAARDAQLDTPTAPPLDALVAGLELVVGKQQDATTGAIAYGKALGQLSTANPIKGYVEGLREVEGINPFRGFNEGLATVSDKDPLRPYKLSLDEVSGINPFDPYNRGLAEISRIDPFITYRRGLLSITGVNPFEVATQGLDDLSKINPFGAYRSGLDAISGIDPFEDYRIGLASISDTDPLASFKLGLAEVKEVDPFAPVVLSMRELEDINPLEGYARGLSEVSGADPFSGLRDGLASLEGKDPLRVYRESLEQVSGTNPFQSYKDGLDPIVGIDPLSAYRQGLSLIDNVNPFEAVTTGLEYLSTINPFISYREGLDAIKGVDPFESFKLGLASITDVDPLAGFKQGLTDLEGLNPFVGFIEALEGLAEINPFEGYIQGLDSIQDVNPFEAYVYGLDAIAAAVKDAGGPTAETERATDLLAKAYGRLQTQVALTGESIKLLNASYESIQERQARIAAIDPFSKYQGALDQLAVYEKLNGVTEETIQYRQLLGQAYAAEQTQLFLTSDAGRAYVDMLEEIKSATEAAITPAEEYARKLAFFERALASEAVSPEIFAKLVKANADEYIAAQERMKEGNDGLSDSTKKLYDELKLAANGFARDLTDVFFDSTKSIGDMFKNLAETIAKALFTQTITEPLITSILGAFKIPGKASGGPVASGQTYVVGERGPELFVPKSSGTILPNGARIGSDAVQPVSVTLNIASVDPHTAAQTIANQERLITGMIRRATLRAGRRPALA